MNKLLYTEALKKFFNLEDFQLFANAIPQGLMTLNEKGDVTFANKLGAEICFAPSDGGARSVTPFEHYSVVLHDDTQVVRDMIEDTINYKREVVRQYSKGSKIYLTQSQPVINQNGEFLGAAITFFDITMMATKDLQHELLYQLSSSLSGVSNVSTVLTIAVRQVVKSMKITSANIMMFNHQHQCLKIMVDSNPTSKKYKPREFKLGEGVAGTCAQTRVPIAIADVSKHPDYIARTPHDKGALLVVPILSKGRLLGVLNVTDINTRYFTESEVQFLTIISNEIGAAIDNSLLYEKLTRKIQQLSNVFVFSSFIGSKTLDTQLQRLVRAVPDLLGVEGCCYYAFQRQTGTFALRYYSETAGRLPNELSMESSPILQNVCKELKAQIIADPKELFPSSEKKKLELVNAMISPVTLHGRPNGVVVAFNKWEGELTEEDKDLSMIIAQRMGSKIENAQLLRRVQSERDMLSRVIENTSEGVAVLDARKRIIIWNDYLEEMTGLKQETVLNQPAESVLQSLLGLKQLTKHLTSATQPTTHSHPHYAEERLKSGEKPWVATICSDIVDANKKVISTVIVFRNISRDKELLQAKDEFVSLTTHELRTPITAVKGYLSMILHGDAGALNPQQKVYFTKAYASVERLVGLVEELLDVFRIEQEGMQFELQTFNLNELINESIEELSQKAKQYNVRVSYDGTVLHHAFADRQKTKQVLQNLLDNAIKYNRDKGSVDVRVVQAPNDVVITIQDTGIGIPQKYIKTIFDRFVRVPNPKSVKVGGAGLGLYIVKRLVERQSGTISVTSPPGQGTQFRITLPSRRLSDTPLPERSHDVPVSV